MKLHVLKLKLRKLHKFIGFTFSIFILHLTITGILLTYPETFKLNKAVFSNNFILEKYGMDTYEDVYQIENNNAEVIIIKKNIYIDKKFIDQFNTNILGIFYSTLTNKLFILSKDTIVIYFFEASDKEIEIIDIKNIKNKYQLETIGYEKSTKRIIFQKEHTYYTIDSNNLVKPLKMINSENFVEVKVALAKKKIAKDYLKVHQGQGVSVIRVITELHNGRFFGSIFTLILFFSSLSLIFLTLSSFIFATDLFKRKKRYRI